ncbi:hypothetical protein SEA_MOAB_198 [Streptomyces phage Moab]|nr:hypothetical protein SEA_MOAB_198 [Streptomyces phage Moab]WMI33802.1 hypothetical protein SEA_PATELGO_200 [Streptomyces phage Patelgo]
MKTATFDYTEMSVVDSSFIDAVYYNAHTNELAVGMLNGDTHFYGDVPAKIFYDIVDGPSAGSAYNRQVKDQFTNLGNGAVHDVRFYQYEENVTKTYDVAGISVVTGTFQATSAAEAAKMFVNDASRYLDGVSVTEVTEIG